MSERSSTILAIDPGTRELGVAVLCGTELTFYGVKTVTNRKNPLAVLETVAAYVRSLIKKHRPDTLSIEKMFVTQKNSAFLVVVAEQIKAVAGEAGLFIYEYAPSTVRKKLCQTGRATKREAAKVLTARYPELGRYYRRTARWELDYYANLFDAVAVGVVCAEEIEESGITNGAV